MVLLTPFGSSVQTVGASAATNIDIQEEEEIKTDNKHEEKMDIKDENFGLSEEELNEIRSETKLEAEPIDEETDEETITTYGVVATVAAVVGIIGGVVRLVTGSYNLGQYGARQVKTRLGVTAAQYKANRWAYRAGITAAFAPTVALGFDDYFYGV